MIPAFGRHVVLVGPTGSGKSQLAIGIARCEPAFEIVSADAMCVYREMDIGTAKPSPDDRAEICHHLIDMVDPSDDYTLTRFQDDVAIALTDIERRGKRALVVGGTGLYVRAVVDGLTVPPRFPLIRSELEAEPDTEALYRRLVALDPSAATKMLPSNRRRVVRALEVCVGTGHRFSSFGPGLDTYGETSFRQVGLWPPRAELAGRVAQRFGSMVDRGFVHEVRGLAARPGGLSRTARQALGYREMLDHVEHDAPLDACVDEAIRATVRFARRQRVWFRRDPRIAWYPPSASPEAIAIGVG